MSTRVLTVVGWVAVLLCALETVAGARALSGPSVESHLLAVNSSVRASGLLVFAGLCWVAAAVTGRPPGGPARGPGQPAEPGAAPDRRGT